ncbi:hypothetical protein CXJ60_004596 [Escherichia coli]|nr:hypothetical protein [Escherichia coli]
MGRRRSHERRDLPPNLYIRNNGYYCYRDPRTGKEFGLGRDRRIAITEAIQANIELFSGHKHKPLTARINSDNSVTLHSWLDRYEKILASRGIKQKTLINYMSKIKAIRRGLPDAPLERHHHKRNCGNAQWIHRRGQGGVSQVNQINTERCIPRGNS